MYDFPVDETGGLYMKRYGIIYKITNKINNKVYIGQTIHSFDKRYYGDIYKNTHNDHLKRAIEKYGVENFEIDKEIFVAYSKELLDAKEQELIELYKSNDKNHGYNYLSGGHNGKHNDESRLKIGLKQKGELNHMFGKFGKENPKYSRIDSNCSYCGKEIAILKCNIKRSERHYCSVECKNKNRKNVMKRTNSKVDVKCSNCNSIFQKFPSQIKEKKYLYCSKECLKEHYKVISKGENNPNFNNGNKVKGGKNGRAKKVICLETNEIFECARDAENKYSISRGLVAACCRGEQKTSKGLSWKYID